MNVNDAGVFHRLIRCRSKQRRWLYIVFAIVIVPLTLWSMEESIWGATPCVVVLVLLAIQFFRPTILGWFTLFVLFFAYGVAMVWHTTSDDYFMGAIFGLAPAIALLWALPRKRKLPHEVVSAF